MSPTWETEADWNDADSQRHVHHAAVTGWAGAAAVEGGPEGEGLSTDLYALHPLAGSLDDALGSNDASVGGGSPQGSSSGGPGDFGYYTFDGTDDYLTVPDSLSTGDVGRTVCMWIYGHDFSDANGVGSFMFSSGGGNCTGESFGLRFRSGDFAIWSGCQGWTSSLSAAENQWKFVAGRFDPGVGYKVWVDTQTDTQSQSSINITADSNYRIGWGGTFQDKHFDGRIGPVWVFDAAVSDAVVESCRDCVLHAPRLITASKTL